MFSVLDSGGGSSEVLLRQGKALTVQLQKLPWRSELIVELLEGFKASYRVAVAGDCYWHLKEVCLCQLQVGELQKEFQEFRDAHVAEVAVCSMAARHSLDLMRQWRTQSN